MSIDPLAQWPAALIPKYRAWHPAANQFYQVYQLEFDVNTGQLSAVHLFDPKTQRRLYTDASEVQLSPFVGWHDKHGTEVYHGDVVKAMLKDEDGTHEVIEQVKIQDDGFLAPFYTRIWYESEWWTESLVDSFEIIGNVYENRNLIDAQSKRK